MDSVVLCFKTFRLIDSSHVSCLFQLYLATQTTTFFVVDLRYHALQFGQQRHIDEHFDGLNCCLRTFTADYHTSQLGCAGSTTEPQASYGYLPDVYCLQLGACLMLVLEETITCLVKLHLVNQLCL